MFNRIILSLMLIIYCSVSYSSGSHIGNGDDGIDLEKTTKVKSGILLDTRKKAVELLRKFDVDKVEHLSALIPEVEKTEIFLVNRDYIKAKNVEKSQEISEEGMVYARTIPKLHASTRFFPQALMLSEQELVSLHIHEGLHRALPADVRENENIVGEITLAITTPGATLDGLKQTVAKHIQPTNIDTDPFDFSMRRREKIEEPSLIEKPSFVQYQYRGFLIDKEDEVVPLRDMHAFEAQFYPIHRKRNAFGVGLGFSLFQFENENAVGPVKLSGHWLVKTKQNYSIRVFAEGTTISLSEDELNRYTFFRDTMSLGGALDYSKPGFYSGVLLKGTSSSHREETLGSVTYTHEYPDVGTAQFRAGVRMGALQVGGLFDFSLASSYRISGEDFEYDSGRSRIISGGPEITLDYAGLKFGLEGRWIIDSTEGVTLDQLGDTFGAGSGKGFVSSRIGYAF